MIWITDLRELSLLGVLVTVVPSLAPVRARCLGVRSCIQSRHMLDLDAILLRTVYALKTVLAATGSALPHSSVVNNHFNSSTVHRRYGPSGTISNWKRKFFHEFWGYLRYHLVQFGS
ncbi:hypothetical protein EDD16DRAFT_1612997 [Pisolithus croceorrhizus]|nr:hypothetical protein EDD16DRAFT_1612997 [Pisolithus croceorrhizus]